jgi:hypothetical protein
VHFETRGVVLGKTYDIERVEDAGSVLNTGGKVNGGDGGKKGYMYSTFCDLILILRFVG